MDVFNDLPLKTRVIVHINYRDIFNAAVHKDELQEWLGIESQEGMNGLKEELNDLVGNKLIGEERGYYYLPGKSHLVEERIRKRKLTIQIIKKCYPFVERLSKIPFIKYVGISGSIAAENPTIDRTGPNAGKIDFDIFIIVKKNSLWIIFYFVRLFKNISLLLRLKRDHVLCMNYVMDESFLEIYNRNFYTATELYNMKRVFGEMDRELLDSNMWYRNYYPNRNNSVVTRQKKSNAIISFINFSFFAFFQLSRCLKRLNFAPFFEINGNFNFSQRHNLKRICPPNGGYQKVIADKFIENFNNYFSDFYDASIFEILFPKESLKIRNSFTEVDDQEINRELFTKYA